MSDEVQQALAPVRARLLGGAAAEASQIIAAAHAEAEAIVRQARREADRTVERARAQGEGEAAAAAAAELRRGRETARSMVLQARREAYQDLRTQVLAAVTGLQAEPGYPELARRLAAMAARAAGPGAAVTVEPEGGAVARARGVIVDCRLPALARRAVDQLAGEAAGLWAP